jgi:hypothetical protein
VVFKGRKDEQLLKLALFTAAVVAVVVGASVYFVDRYAEYGCGPDEHLALDFECHADFTTVEVPPTTSTQCGEGEVLTGGNRCIELGESPG